LTFGWPAEVDGSKVQSMGFRANLDMKLRRWPYVALATPLGALGGPIIPAFRYGSLVAIVAAAVMRGAILFVVAWWVLRQHGLPVSATVQGIVDAQQRKKS
jgi:hypothetical protein